MLKERLFITAIAILGGIFFSIGLFYLYQKTKVVAPSQISKAPQPQPAEQTPFSLDIESPQDEEVFNKRLVPLAGKTNPQAIVIISTEDRELVLIPSSDGSFSANLTLLDGVNLIEVMATSPDENTLTKKMTLTFSTESF